MAARSTHRRPLQPNPSRLNRQTATLGAFPHPPATFPSKPPTSMPSTTSRDEALRSLLLQHREQRALIQSSLSPNDLASKLSAALEQVSRLDRDFQTFRTRAARQLADAREENRLLRARLATVDGGKLGKLEVKPTERMLSVDEIRDAKKKVDEKPTHRGVRSLRPLRNVNPSRRAPDRPKDAREPRRMSLRPGKENVGPRVDRELDADERQQSRGDRTSRASRRSSLLPRSISRKWSACF